MNKYEFRGRITQARGKVKEITGKLFGNKLLEGQGRIQNAAGRIQAGYGELQDDTRKRRSL